MTLYRKKTGENIARFIHYVKPTIVDVGGGGATRAWMEGVLGRKDFETWDNLPGPEVTRVVNIMRLEDAIKGYAQTVLCSSVLEHVQNPFVAAEWLSKLARAGGTLILTVPFSYEYHAAPKDYWRFTQDGVLALFDRYFNLVSCDSYEGNSNRTGIIYCGLRKP